MCDVPSFVANSCSNLLSFPGDILCPLYVNEVICSVCDNCYHRSKESMGILITNSWNDSPFNAILPEANLLSNKK